MTDHARKIGKNATWGILGFILPTLIMLVTIPLFIRFLGKRHYGLWAILNATVGMLGLLNLGLGDAATKFIAEYVERQRPDLVNLVATLTLGLYLVLGGVGTMVLFVLAPWLSYNFFELRQSEQEIAVVSFRLISFGITPSLALPAVIGVLNGFQRYRESQILNMVRSTGIAIAGVVVLWAGHGLCGLVAVNVFILWGLLLVSVLYLWTRLQVRPHSPRLHRRESVAILSFGFYSMISRLGMLAFASIDKILIGRYIDISVVTYYSVCQNVGSKIHMLVVSFSQVLMPFFSSKGATRENETKLSRQFLTSWRVSILVTLAISAFATACSPWLLKVWINPAFHHNSFWILLIFFAIYTTSALMLVPYFYLLGRGYPAYIAWTLTACGLVFLGLIRIFGAEYGIVAVTLSFSTYAVFSLCIANRALKLSDVILPEIIRGIWFPFGITATSVCLGLISGSIVEAWTNIAVMALSMSVLTTGCCLLAGHIFLSSFPQNSYVRPLLLLTRRVPGLRALIREK